MNGGLQQKDWEGLYVKLLYFITYSLRVKNGIYRLDRGVTKIRWKYDVFDP